MTNELNAKTVIVIGAASGIGAACADYFVARGANVAALDIVFANDWSNTYSRVHCDVTSSISVESAIGSVANRYHRIDVLICCAGYCPAERPSHLVSDEQWHQTMTLNCDGVFFCNRAVIPHMLAAGAGRIVNVASLAAQRGDPMQAAYSAAKAAVVAMSKAMGREYASQNILINVVIPGIIDTPPLRAMPAHLQQRLQETIPVGRAGTPQEVADLIGFLASDNQGYLAGGAFEIAGGRGT